MSNAIKINIQHLLLFVNLFYGFDCFADATDNGKHCPMSVITVH